MNITFYYDLLFLGGVETSSIDLLRYLTKKYNVNYAHRDQYFTQQATVNRMEEILKKPLINMNEDKINTDICVFTGMLFDYEDIFPKIMSKVNIGWIHFIPGKQCTYENMLMYEKYRNKLDYYICVSERSKKGLLEMIPDAKVEVIHNTINADLIKELSEEEIEYKKEDGILTFVTASRIGKDKGFDKCYLLFDELIKRNIPYVWYVIGATVNEDDIRDIIEKANTYNIVLVGLQDNPYKYIKLGDYGLLTSPEESHCIFVDECHILGVPTITTEWDVIYERPNIEDYAIILKQDMSNIDVDRIVNENARLKENLRNKYKYVADYEKWDKFLKRIAEEKGL